ncbi:hypothetical protein BB934_37800 (plasmid) [Microvirga ossetica]|uniref:Uncharacterized protein n=1 Tax=Microvirga ossetica TaxID=1882682 RepID=A0A1B2EVN7_9HYPH|nr:hypothetical protein [Microvirga ossetica]ANY84021.1 hypothetical protein BB934_37800 [Microvirga ossetica]
MPTTSGRSSLAEIQDFPPTYPPELQPLRQTLLATLASIDSAHEGDVETVRNSTVDEWLKQDVIRRLEEGHRERRVPYLRQIEELESCIRATAT